MICMEDHSQNTSPFSTPDYMADPYPYYAGLRADAPVVERPLPDGWPVYVITRYADVLAALKDAGRVKNVGNARPEMKHVKGIQNQTLLNADRPEHARLRALAQEAFKPKYVNQMRAHIQEIADRLVDAVEARGKPISLIVLRFRCQSLLFAKSWVCHRKTIICSGNGQP